MCTVQMVSTITVTRQLPETAPSVGMVGGTHITRTAMGVSSLRSPGPSWWSHPPDDLQHELNKNNSLLPLGNEEETTPHSKRGAAGRLGLQGAPQASSPCLVPGADPGRVEVGVVLSPKQFLVFPLSVGYHFPSSYVILNALIFDKY